MAIATVHLFSKTLGMCDTVTVILPQRKDAAPGKKLKVLWLLHGAFGNHGDWTRYTGIERYVRPYGLAVVMPSAQNSCYTDMAHGLRYYSYISRELPALLPTMMNLSSKREDNFIAGLSMGGAGSLMIGLSQPKKYAAIGCLSAGDVNAEGTFHNGPQYALTFGDSLKEPYKRPLDCARRILEKDLPCPRIYHACGSDDFLLPSAHRTRDFFSSLPGNPFAYEFHENPGAHTWDFWDEHIREFIEFLRLPVVESDYV